MMIPLDSALRSFSTAIQNPILPGLLLRITLIAAAGQLALALLPRAAAAVRHLLAVTALAACLLLPVAAATLPSWRVPILPAAASAAIATPRATLPVPSPVSPVAAPARAYRVPVARPSVPPARAFEALPVATAPVVFGAPAPARSALPWTTWLALSVALVSLLLLTRIAVLLAVARIVALRAERVLDERMLLEFARAARDLDLAHAGEVRVSRRVTVPVVSGVFAGGLLIPTEAFSWSQERLHAVFLHELAHVRRRDGVASLILRSASALFWFHPLVVSLARIARRDCERACDDMVLEQGVRPSDYARHLLEIARAATGRGFSGLTLAFARRSSLETRLIAILKDDLRRSPVSRSAVAAAAVLALLATLPLAAVRVVAAPSSRAAAKAAPAWTSATATATSTSTSTSVATRTETHTTTSSSTSPSVVSEGELLAHKPFSSSDDKDQDTYDRAKSLYDSQRYDEAGTMYERAAVAGIRTGTAYYNAACSFALDGQRNRAVGDLVAALDAGFSQTDLLQTDSDLNSIRSDKRFQLILKGLASSDEGMQQRNDAVSDYKRLKSDNSKDAGAWKSVSMSLMRSGETEKSVDGFTRQFAIDSSSSSVYNRACALALGGKTDAALDALERSIVIGYDDAGHIQEDADLVSLHSSKRFDDLVELAKDLELNGMNHWDDTDEWRHEVARYDRVAREHPTLGRAWFNLGFAQLRAHDPSGSRDSYMRALNLGYRLGATNYNLACAAAQMGETDNAIRWLERSQAAGLDVGSLAGGDDDLKALRSDPRFLKMLDDSNDKMADKKGSKHKKS
jgi:beta-lactamase regulating signal transducer with metallopeptidase domain